MKLEVLDERSREDVREYGLEQTEWLDTASTGG
ncbi:predicted protein [Sclerotinia sclerotiorum 1980 UF-70]|uniref:Uncharacterized protein n=1 Tax=Sclerotinia sclerotiorum (strain ATCC 18683 / 1980 / Ss-1) TaxID=665079 RepID=A7EJW3_SCLS1|nr:predicted protein [Sclerotinia sclerotiorum 1980 UF-70]EDO03129.1 predicted protein [Sclerotinia sclerotiorum 1980 UF-70]